MSIAVSCACGRSFVARDDLAGKRVKCPVCGQPIEVPLVATLADPLDRIDGLMSSPAAGRSLAPAVAAGQSTGGLNMLVIGAISGAGVVALLGLMAVAVWSMRPSVRTADAAGTTVTAHATPATPPQPSPSRTNSPKNPSAPASAPPPPPAATKSGFSSASPPTPPTTWTAGYDPPSQPIAWPKDLSLSIPVRGFSSNVIFPATASRFVGVGDFGYSGVKQASVWDVFEQKQVGQLPEDPTKVRDKLALSPDGRFLAAQLQISDNNSKIRLWSMATGQVHRELQCDDPKCQLDFLEFAGKSRVVTFSHGTIDKETVRRLRVWDLSSEAQLHEVPVGETSLFTKWSVSPGGRYVAAGGYGTKLFVFDVESGNIAGEIKLESLPTYTRSTLHGLSFSPDGRELGIVFGTGNTQVAFIDLEKGDFSTSFELAGQPPVVGAYKGDAVEWLDERGWCLFGASVVDKKSQHVVWTLSLPIGNQLMERRVTPSGWIYVSNSRDRRLTYKPIPWQKIDSSIAAMQSNGDAYLKPGGKISLDIHVGELRFGTAEDSAKRLEEAFKTRFKTDKIEVAPDQPLTMVVRFSETGGDTLQQRGKPGEPSTGKTVQATKSLVSMEMKVRGKNDSVWSHEMNHDPKIATIFNKEVSDASARDSTFKQLLYALNSVPIPYFVAADDTRKQLPGSIAIDTD